MDFKKLKKRRVLGLLLVFFILLCFCLRSKSYEITYTRDDVTIVESFFKKEKVYTFLFQVEDKEFILPITSKYKHTKKIVDNIVVNKKEDTICIIPEGSLSFYPLCMQNDELVSYHLIKDNELVPEVWYKEIESIERTFQNFKIYHLNHHKYFVWNYKGFYIIDEKGENEISLFKEDIYNLPLAMQVDNYLLVADYDSKYEFKKFYVIDSKNNKMKGLSIEKELSFDSYFLGSNSKKVYFVDKKNKQEYEIIPKRLLINKITKNNQGKILVNGDWEFFSMTSLVTSEKKFSYSKKINYEIVDNTLYLVVDTYKIKLSDHNVKEIVYSDNTIVYYLVGDQLYYYDVSDGEVLVMSNFEWNFNYKNMIFIF